MGKPFIVIQFRRSGTLLQGAGPKGPAWIGENADPQRLLRARNVIAEMRGDGNYCELRTAFSLKRRCRFHYVGLILGYGPYRPVILSNVNWLRQNCRRRADANIAPD